MNESNYSTIIENLVFKEFEDGRKIRPAVTTLIVGYVSPNLSLDKEITVTVREEIVKKVGPVYRKWHVKKNELIIEKGKRVNSENISQLVQLRRVFRPGTTPTFFIGIVLLFLLLGMIASIYIKLTGDHKFLIETRKVSIILINMFFMIVLADFIMSSPQPSYFVPVAGIGMMITLLLGFNIAFLSVVLVSVLISMLVGGGIEIFVVLLVGSIVSMFAVREARRRAQILWAGLLGGIAKSLAIVCIGLINSMEFDFYTKDGIWGIASGLFAGFIVMGFLPVFEHLFKIPTNISMLELTDLNHSVLKKLAMEAPGTYHHSIMVGNLSEAACDAIGANSLKARVGAYYHDIGKISKAEYFSENEMGSGSRHAKLSPSMSSLIISKHVKDGVELAKKYKLNNAIIDFIEQHHGDSLIAYFYNKASEQNNKDKAIEEDKFRYPGPKPQTKESAIVLLADSVEASSRTLKDPTPYDISSLVKKIINNNLSTDSLRNVS